jgi:hypothetical protein
MLGIHPKILLNARTRVITLQSMPDQCDQIRYEWCGRPILHNHEMFDICRAQKGKETIINLSSVKSSCGDDPST